MRPVHSLACLALAWVSCAAPPTAAPPPAAPPAAETTAQSAPAHADLLTLSMQMLDKELAILREGGECATVAEGLRAHADADHEALHSIFTATPSEAESGALQARAAGRAPEVEALLDPFAERCGEDPAVFAELARTFLQLYLKSAPAPASRAPEPLVASTAVALPAATPTATSTAPAPAGTLTTYAELGAALGSEVVVQGTVSRMVYQHMMPMNPEARQTLYLDLTGGSQITVISKDRIPCKGTVRLRGRVSEVSGPGKGGGGTHRELYVSASKWDCIEP